MTAKNLQEILRKHTLWLNGDPDGEKADLSDANLSGANGLLSAVNFMEANFERTENGYIAYKTFGGQYTPPENGKLNLVLSLKKM